MNHDLIQKAEQYGKKHKKQRLWKRSIGIMGLILAFSTAYALVLPAITQERPLICGYEEHTHTDECLSPLPVLICTAEENHLHDPAVCYMQKEGIICGYEETEGHTHDETCYSQQEVILCGLEETAGHIHDDSCYTEQSILGCGTEESSGHSHTDSCRNNVLICSTTENTGHTHDESCRDADGVLICGIEESAGHIHGDGCYESQITCGLSEGDGAHSHSEDCYINERVLICEQTECDPHTHDDSCKGFESVLSCGQEEHEAHTHDDSCKGMLDVLLCTEPENHLHEDGCYETPAPCVLKEHKHTDSCYGESSNPNADLESSADWEYTMQDVELTGVWAEDILAIAKTQLGYEESSRNFIYDENYNKKGYTRYGEWYGVPYGDWCAMFVAFCLEYAEIPEDVFPRDAACDYWVDELIPLGLYAEADEYTPVPGDLIFYDWDDDPYAEHIGIVAWLGEYTDSDTGEVIETVTAIEGNTSNMVAYRTYDLDDPCVIGYGLLPEKEVEPEPETTEDPESTEPDMSDYAAWAVLTDGTDEEISDNIPEPTEIIPFEETGEIVAFSEASGVMLLSARNATATSVTLDLTPWINSVTMLHKVDGTWVEIDENATVTEGDNLKFTIDYTIPGQQLGTDVNTVVYQIPSSITAVNASSGVVYNDEMQEVGTFSITADAITITFNEDYTQKNADGQQIHGNISFVAVIGENSSEGDENIEFVFTDGITLGVTVTQKEEATGDILIEKSNAQINSNTITYEMLVTSNEGTYDVVQLSDIMTGGLKYNGNFSIVDQNGTPVTDIAPVLSEDSTGFTLTLPLMAAGSTYTIRYDTELPEEALVDAVTVNNKASVSTKNDKDMELTDSSEVNHTFEMLKKTGTSNDDGTVSWTIRVNKAKIDISGWILSDTININGTDQALDATVTIKDSVGTTVYTGKLPFTFPNSSDDTYTVTYTTQHELSGEVYNVINKAQLERDNDPTDTPIEEESKVGIGVGDPLSKSGEVLPDTLRTDEDGNQWVEVRWTVTIDTKDGPIGSGVLAVDNDGKDRTNSWFFMDKLDDDQYMTYDQLMAAVNSFKTALGEYAGNGSYRAQVYDTATSGGATYYNDREPYLSEELLYERFRIYLPVQIPQGKTFTFSYTSWAPVQAGLYKYENRVNFNNYDPYEVTGNAHYRRNEPTIDKSAKYVTDSDREYQYFEERWYEWSGESYDSDINLNFGDLYNNLLCWQIQVDIPNTYVGSLTVTEHLPDGLTPQYIQSRSRYSEPLSVRWWDYNTSDTSPCFSWERDTDGDGVEEIIQIPISISGNDITFTVDEDFVAYLLDNIPEAVQAENGHRIYFFIYASIDEDFDWVLADSESLTSTGTFANTVTLEGYDGIELDTSTQTQTITKERFSEVITKTAGADDNIITYRVVLNKDALDLSEDSDALAVEDVMTYMSTDSNPLTAQLIPGSVKLNRYDTETGTVGNAVNFSYKYSKSSQETDSGTEWSHKLNLTVPDQAALLLEYKYYLTGITDSSHTIDNRCTMAGIYQGSISDDEDILVTVEDTTAFANIKGVNIYKVDLSNEGIYLPGAVFNLYMWNNEQQKYVQAHHPNDTTEESYRYTTDSNGKLTLDTSTVAELAYNTAYYLEEVGAPDGYFLNGLKYYFYIEQEDTTVYPECMPDDFTGEALKTGAFVYYYDAKATTDIGIKKLWQDHTGTVKNMTDGTVTFELWRKAVPGELSDTLVDTYTVTATTATGTTNTYPITANPEFTWNYTISGLPKAVTNTDGTAGESYLYYIKEVTADGYIVTYSANNTTGINEGVLTMTNTEIPYELPETGGSGTGLYTFTGLALMGTAFGALLHRHRKKAKEDPIAS